MSLLASLQRTMGPGSAVELAAKSSLKAATGYVDVCPPPPSQMHRLNSNLYSRIACLSTGGHLCTATRHLMYVNLAMTARRFSFITAINKIHLGQIYM
jgi:hypothetical protein